MILADCKGVSVRRMLTTVSILAGGVGAYVLVVRGALTLDLGLGRRVRPLGPLRVLISAPRATVFEVVSAPYLGKTPRAMARKLEVLERGSDMVLASHHTPIAGGLRATTVETVRFDPPGRIGFRLLRGPVPHVLESFELHERDGRTELEYRGELGTDLWRLGSWWGERVAGPWERTVEQSLEDIRKESERRAGARG